MLCFDVRITAPCEVSRYADGSVLTGTATHRLTMFATNARVAYNLAEAAFPDAESISVQPHHMLVIVPEDT